MPMLDGIKTRPLSPEEMIKQRHENIPSFVFEAFNNCILKNMNGSCTEATVKQNELIDEIQRCSPSELNRQSIIDNKWLDLEDHYRKAGWIVEYDKPGYCESYEAYFVFKVKKK